MCKIKLRKRERCSIKIRIFEHYRQTGLEDVLRKTASWFLPLKKGNAPKGLPSPFLSLIPGRVWHNAASSNHFWLTRNSWTSGSHGVGTTWMTMHTISPVAAHLIHDQPAYYGSCAKMVLFISILQNVY